MFKNQERLLKVYDSGGTYACVVVPFLDGEESGRSNDRLIIERLALSYVYWPGGDSQNKFNPLKRGHSSTDSMDNLCDTLSATYLCDPRWNENSGCEAFGARMPPAAVATMSTANSAARTW